MKVYDFLFEQSNIQKKSRPYNDQDQFKNYERNPLEWINQIYKNLFGIECLKFIYLYILNQKCKTQ